MGTCLIDSINPQIKKYATSNVFRHKIWKFNCAKFCCPKNHQNKFQGVLKEEFSDMSKHDTLIMCKVRVLCQWDDTTTLSMYDATSGTIVADSHYQTSIH
jgi:hypothetical protein